MTDLKYYVNIKSISKNFDELTVLLDSLAVNFDVIILTESWLINTDLSLFNLNNYNVYSTKNYLNRCDGVVIFVKENLNVECN